MPALDHAAVVSRPCREEEDVQTYLCVSPQGSSWVADPLAATAFPSMREAARAALRLPASVRAFGLPREPELALYATH